MLKFLIFIIIFNCLLIQLKGQSYKCDLDQFTINDFNEKCIKEITGRVTRYNRTVAVLNANATILLPLDHMKLRAAVFALQGNEFRQIFVVSKEDLVEAIKEDLLVYDAIIPKSNFPPRNNLQFPPGFYWVKHFVIEASPPPIMYGHKNWKVDLVLLNKDDTFCVNISVTIKVVNRLGF